MKTLSITQPWASLIAWGEKRIETRSWRTDYRGWLAIHATRNFPAWARESCEEEPFAEALERHGVTSWRELPTGAVLAIARLVDCRHTGAWGSPSPYLPPVSSNERQFGDYTPGRWMWFLKEVRALPEPMPAPGALYLWEWDGIDAGADLLVPST